MTEYTSAYLFLVLSIGLAVVGQLSLKVGMSRRRNFRLADAIGLVRDWNVVAGFGCYGVSLVLYLKVLETLALSLAYPTLSLGYAIIVLASGRYLKERISLWRWVAVSFICIGVALVGLGS